MSFIIAIDGPAGAGKGTITKQVADQLGFINIDTGAMFRCVTLKILQEKIEIESEKAMEKLLETIEIEIKESEDRKSVV